MDSATRTILQRRYLRAVLRAVGVDVSGVTWRGGLDALWMIRHTRPEKEPLPDFPTFCEAQGFDLSEAPAAPPSKTQMLRGF